MDTGFASKSVLYFLPFFPDYWHGKDERAIVHVYMVVNVLILSVSRALQLSHLEMALERGCLDYWLRVVVVAGGLRQRFWICRISPLPRNQYKMLSSKIYRLTHFLSQL